MKILFSLVAFTCLWFSTTAQTINHPTIKSYTVNVSDAPTPSIPSGAEAAVLVTYVFILEDSADVSKVWVRVSSDQQSVGNLLNTFYLIDSAPVTDEHGVVLFKRYGSVIAIRAIIANMQEGSIYEICTENAAGQKTPYLSQVR